MGVLPSPKNQLDKFPAAAKNPLDGGIPSMPSSVSLPSAPPTAGEDPCSSSAYLKDKLTSMPIIGNLSLADLAPNVNLDEITAPKIPSMSEIGSDIKSGVSDAFNDMKDEVSGVMDDLKPSNLIPELKQQAGIVGREALAEALESAMSDALGPVKDGIGNRVMRSVKQNLMMAGISEVANIIAGEPNIFDPCAGKDKMKTNNTSIANASETGRLNSDINKSINNQSTQFAAASNRNARDLVEPKMKPALPQIGNQPPLPAGDNSGYASAVKANQQATAKVTDAAIKDVAQKTAKKQAQNEHRKDQESSAPAGETATGNHFPIVKKPGVKYHYINSTIIGPQSGWSGSGDDNSDIITTINGDLNSLFIQSLETRSDYEPVVTGSVSESDLTKLLDDIHTRNDIEQQFYDYQESLDLEPRHYMIWCRVMTISNSLHVSGKPQVVIKLEAIIFRTCDQCGDTGNYTTHSINVSQTMIGQTVSEKPIETYKSAISLAINADEFQNKLRNELMSVSR